VSTAGQDSSQNERREDTNEHARSVFLDGAMAKRWRQCPRTEITQPRARHPSEIAGTESPARSQTPPPAAAPMLVFFANSNASPGRAGGFPV
jgi:hypothetical protein